MKSKMKRGNAGIVFLICALFVVIIAMGIYMLLDKTDSSQGIVNDNGENTSNNIQENVINSNSTLSAFTEMQTISIDNLGKVYIDNSGNTVYFDPTNINKDYFPNLTITTPDSIHYASYNPDPTNSIANLSFNGYKLDLTNVQTAYGIVYGNGSGNMSIIFVHKNGNISELSFNNPSDQTSVALTKNVPGCSNIVSVVQHSTSDGHSAILIDTNGKSYHYFGINK